MCLLNSPRDKYKINAVKIRKQEADTEGREKRATYHLENSNNSIIIK
jgi:hypothetical protein